MKKKNNSAATRHVQKFFLVRNKLTGQPICTNAHKHDSMKTIFLPRLLFSHFARIVYPKSNSCALFRASFFYAGWLRLYRFVLSTEKEKKLAFNG